MSLHDELTEAQHCLDELVRAVGRLERSLAQLRAAGPAPDPLDRANRAAPVDGVITITEAPYDGTLWTDSDDEGLGVRGRHAP